MNGRDGENGEVSQKTGQQLVDSLIKLETFKDGGFNVANLVDALMEEDVRKAKNEGGGKFLLDSKRKRGDGGFDIQLATPTVSDFLGSSHLAFDPKPHIRTLEEALSLLLPLRKANAAKTTELERAVAAAERTYRGDVRGAKAGFEVGTKILLNIPSRVWADATLFLFRRSQPSFKRSKLRSPMLGGRPSGLVRSLQLERRVNIRILTL